MCRFRRGGDKLGPRLSRVKRAAHGPARSGLPRTLSRTPQRRSARLPPGSSGPRWADILTAAAFPPPSAAELARSARGWRDIRTSDPPNIGTTPANLGRRGGSSQGQNPSRVREHSRGLPDGFCRLMPTSRRRRRSLPALWR